MARRMNAASLAEDAADSFAQVRFTTLAWRLQPRTARRQALLPPAAPIGQPKRERREDAADVLAPVRIAALAAAVRVRFVIEDGDTTAAVDGDPSAVHAGGVEGHP